MRKMGIIKRLDDDTNPESEIGLTVTAKQKATDSLKGPKGAAGTTFEMRLMRVRKNATVRERRRLAEVNRAYTELSRQVPQQLLGNATKLEVLRGAAQYIHLLMVMLGKNDVIYDAPTAATEMDQQDENMTSSEWCSHDSNNNLLEYDVMAINGSTKGVITSVSTLANNSRPAARPQALTTVSDSFSYPPSSCHTALSSGISGDGHIDVDITSNCDNDAADERTAEFSYVQSGVLKLDDPPPKANISWR